MKQVMSIRDTLAARGDIRPAVRTINDKARQNAITKQLSRVNAILARRALTAH